MENSSFIIIDATVESQAPFFAQNPIFQRWLRAFNNVAEALQFISQIRLPYSINVYLARDNILDDGLPSDINGQTRTLIQTVSDLRTIRHVVIFTPKMSAGLEQQIRAITPDPRVIKQVISVIDLHFFICKEGICCFQEEMSRCIVTKEAHLIPNLSRNRDELWEYLEKVKNDRQQILDALVEEHYNRPGEEPE